MPDEDDILGIQISDSELQYLPAPQLTIEESIATTSSKTDDLFNIASYVGEDTVEVFYDAVTERDSLLRKDIAALLKN